MKYVYKGEVMIANGNCKMKYFYICKQQHYNEL